MRDNTFAKETKLPAVVWIGIMTLLLSLSSLMAVPPVTTTQQFTDGYRIKIPQDNILEKGQGYEFEFHVFQISNGTPIIDNIVCYFHLYNESGNHVYSGIDNKTSHDFDYSFDLKGGNFSRAMRMYYNIQCNSTNFGGDEYSILIVTNSGKEMTDSQGNIYLGLLLSITILYFFFGYLSFKFTDKEKTFPIGLFFLLVALILSVYSIYIGVVYSRDYLDLSISEPQTKIFIGLLFGLTGVIFISLLFLIIKAIKEIKERKSVLNYGERLDENSYRK